MPDMMSNKGRTEFMRNDSGKCGGFLIIAAVIT